METGDEDHPIQLGEFTMVSMGWTNPTPWHTFREAEEPELAVRIDRRSVAASDPETTIFNFHAPPYGSKLDNAPALNDDLTYVSGGQAIRPVGSTSVHESIKRFQPLLSLHGHIHESKGASTRIGKTLALNPGQLLRGGHPASGGRDHRRQEAEGQELPTGERLDGRSGPLGGGAAWQR